MLSQILARRTNITFAPPRARAFHPHGSIKALDPLSVVLCFLAELTAGSGTAAFKKPQKERND
jgi:hypothetical protein